MKHIKRKNPTIFTKDEFIKQDTSVEILSGNEPAFRKDGSVTAGNASGLNDGMATVLVASAEAVEKYDLKPIARIVASEVVGVEPRIMGMGPVEATRRVLKKVNPSLR